MLVVEEEEEGVVMMQGRQIFPTMISNWSADDDAGKKWSICRWKTWLRMAREGGMIPGDLETWTQGANVPLSTFVRFSGFLVLGGLQDFAS